MRFSLGIEEDQGGPEGSPSFNEAENFLFLTQCNIYAQILQFVEYLKFH